MRTPRLRLELCGEFTKLSNAVLTGRQDTVEGVYMSLPTSHNNGPLVNPCNWFDVQQLCPNSLAKKELIPCFRGSTLRLAVCA